jgi:hypothetical protein
MSRRIAFGLAALLVVAFGLAAGTGVAREILDVRVRNWPDVQNVRGRVAIEGAIRQAEEVAFEELLVTPVARESTSRLVEAGVVEAAGYASVAVSVVGEISGEALQSGQLGVVLVPETKRVLRAFREDGLFLFPLEVTAPVRGGQQVYAAGGTARFELAFPRYRVFLYNTSDKAIRVDLHLYLSA